MGNELRDYNGEHVGEVEGKGLTSMWQRLLKWIQLGPNKELMIMIDIMEYGWSPNKILGEKEGMRD